MGIVLGIIIGVTGIHGTLAGSSGTPADAKRHFNVVLVMALSCILTQIGFVIAFNTSKEATSLTETQKRALSIFSVIICIITIVICGLCAWCGRAFQEEARSLAAPPTQGIPMQAMNYGQPQAMSYGGQQPPPMYGQSFVMAQPQYPAVNNQAAQPPGQVHRNAPIDPSFSENQSEEDEDPKKRRQ